MGTCSRKDRSAIVWGTAASRWGPDWRAAQRPRSHRVPGVRHRVAGLQAVRRAGRKLCRRWADVARSGFDSELASGWSPEIRRRAPVSGMAASRCNPAAPQTLLRCSSADWRKPPLVQQRLALARLPPDLDQEHWSRQNSRQGTEQPRSRSERTMRIRLDRRQADEVARSRLAAIPLCPCRQL